MDCWVFNVLHYPNTKRPTSISQKRFIKAPVANIICSKVQQCSYNYTQSVQEKPLSNLVNVLQLLCESKPTCPTQTKREKMMVPILRKTKAWKKISQKATPLSLLIKTVLNSRWLLCLFVPDAKNPVEQESPEEAEDHVGPGVPGIQLHERSSVQVEVLVKAGRRYGGSLHLICFEFILLKSRLESLCGLAPLKAAGSLDCSGWSTVQFFGPVMRHVALWVQHAGLGLLTGARYLEDLSLKRSRVVVTEVASWKNKIKGIQRHKAFIIRNIFI